MLQMSGERFCFVKVFLIKGRPSSAGCGSLKWTWHSRFADGLKIHGWLYNSCRTSGNHICVGHTGISTISCALSCKFCFAHTLESD